MSLITSSPINQVSEFDISVVIPTYNRVGFLDEALKCVKSQDFNGTVETIVVDDNSQDGTSEFVRRNFADILLISLNQNVGAASARNQAIAIARGKYIAFLDSDDLWDNSYLSIQFEALEKSNRCFSVSNLVIWNTATNEKNINVQSPNLKKYLSPIHNLLVSSFIRTLSCVVIPRLALDEVGAFDENFRQGEDPELYIRCLQAGYNIIFTDQPLVIKREHQESQLTDSIKHQGKYRLMRIKKFFQSSLPEGCIQSVPSQRRVYAEYYTFIAKQFLRNDDLLNWLISSIKSVYYSSPKYALSNMKFDIMNISKYGGRLRVLKKRIQVSL